MNMLERFARNHENVPAIRNLDDLLHLAYGAWNDFAPELLNEHMCCGNHLSVEVEEKEVVATLPFAGVKSSDFDVSVEGDQLNVAVACEDKYDDRKGKKILRRERTFSSYSESVALPVRVKGDCAKAAYKDGVLTVTIPRMENKAPKSTTVKVD